MAGLSHWRIAACTPLFLQSLTEAFRQEVKIRVACRVKIKSFCWRILQIGTSKGPSGSDTFGHGTRPGLLSWRIATFAFTPGICTTFSAMSFTHQTPHLESMLSRLYGSLLKHLTPKKEEKKSIKAMIMWPFWHHTGAPDSCHMAPHWSPSLADDLDPKSHQKHNSPENA